MEKVNFEGTRDAMGCVVTVNGGVLDPREDLVSHAPASLGWGYLGRGSAQLALAILAYLYDDRTAKRYHQLFKERVINALPYNHWRLSSEEVEASMKILRGELDHLD